MKTIKTALVALALSAAIAGPTAADVSGQSIQGAVRSAVTNGNVNVKVEDGVATLFGWVEDRHTENKVKRAALSFDNIDSIVDRIVVSN